MIVLSREFWIRETGTGQQVAQLHERYMMMMMMMMMMMITRIQTAFKLKNSNQAALGQITGIQEKLDTTCK